MPELPEVETIRRDLLGVVLYKPIVKVEVRKDKIVKNTTANFIHILTDNQFLDIERRGKLLSFSLMGDWYLLTHLKMTGQLMYQDKKGIIAGGHSFSSDEYTLPGPYSYVIFDFADNTNLYFNCMRQFGYMHIVDQKQKDKAFAAFGPEPLDTAFTLKKFKAIIKGKKTNVKAFLLNQKLIAGIGNIYVDESCFVAGIRPERSVATLSEEEIKKLYHAIRKVLRLAVQERGTTFNNYRDANGKQGNFVKFLKVYGRGGEKCRACGKELKKGRIAGRGTVWCDLCQR